MLSDCPYCGRPAELAIEKEMSDTSKIHKIRCSYLNCVAIEKSLSGWSPTYNDDLNHMTSDWNTLVIALTKNILQRKADNE